MTVVVPAAAGSSGQYIGEVVAKWLDDGRLMQLERDFRYIDPSGEEWLAPSGAKVDGASIPPAAWPIIGSPFVGKYRNASVVHDVACDTMARPWQATHRMFYDAMLTSGVGTIKAMTMYAAVLIGGPKWSRTVRIYNVPFGQAQDKAFLIAKTESLSGEVANTRILIGTGGQSGGVVDPIPGLDLPSELATVEIEFAPQPSVHLTEEQVRALEKEIEKNDLTVEQIEKRYLVQASE